MPVAFEPGSRPVHEYADEDGAQSTRTGGAAAFRPWVPVCSAECPATPLPRYLDAGGRERAGSGAWQNARMSETVPADIQAAFDLERERARSDVAQAKDAAASRTLTVRMYGRLSALQQQVISREAVPVACVTGCAYCCSQRVEVRAYEAFVLAQFILTRKDPAQRDLLLGRLSENLCHIAPLTRAQHVRAGIACALLHEGACSVYEARPAACRKYYSVSVDTCRAAAADPDAPLSGPLEHDNLRFAGNAIALGFAKGAEEAGFNTDVYELHGALKAALDSNKPEKRYRDGKKPFV
jgi:Fe-S-cluster containining protein